MAQSDDCIAYQVTTHTTGASGENTSNFFVRDEAQIG